MKFFKRNKKKDELKYDPLNMKITQLDKGFFVDYEMESYEVTEVYNYEWESGLKGKEFQLDSGRKKLYLYMEHDDDLEISICEKISLQSIDKTLSSFIVENDEPPDEIHYKGLDYTLQQEQLGHCQKKGDEEWDAVISWEFVDEFETSILTIERWGERKFEAAFGPIVREIEFSNITPPPES